MFIYVTIILQDEIQRGHMIFQSNKSFSDPFPWGLLSTSAKKDFFLSAPRYIQVDFDFLVLL